jgi:hypothetical protein
MKLHSSATSVVTSSMFLSSPDKSKSISSAGSYDRSASRLDRKITGSERLTDSDFKDASEMTSPS